MLSRANIAGCGFWAALLSLIVGGVQGQTPSKAALLTDLQHGGYVILMRHASSPKELPDAAHVNPDNASDERQLDSAGIASASAMGEALRRLNIPIGDVLSSPTYRALQTIMLAQLGRPTSYGELGDGGQSMRADKRGTRAAWLKARSASVPGPHENTLIVTHFPNIIEAYPDGAAGLADGEALILHPDGHGGVLLVARVKIDEWMTLDSIG
jgi:phosphohistidine phosphatase SixA